MGGDKPWSLESGVLTTPTTTHDNPWSSPVTDHASTKKTYPDGFILEIEFSFDTNQKPIFPMGQEAQNKHRPTFLGNSGIAIYNWVKADGSPVGYLYEVQVTDVNGMTGGTRNILNKNRFLRLDYGADWTQKGVWALLGPNEAAILAAETSYNDPKKYGAFKTEIEKGGADSLCAFVAGLPVSYFQDVYLKDVGKGEFPRPGIAVSSPIPQGADKAPIRPISGVEDPLDMCFAHRADYVVSDTGGYRHFNKPNSGDWNTLRVCFLPARYDGGGKKCKNAYLDTMVNASESYKGGFTGEIKSGTRTSRRTSGQDPEPQVYVEGNGDKKIRLLGHWGSTVKYRNVTIRSIGSMG